MDSDLSFLQRVAVKKARKVVTRLFSEHSVEDVEKSILAGSSLVKSEAPDEYREWLEENGEDYEWLVRKYARPERVWGWLRNPEWAEDDETKENLTEIADTIVETPGGKQWFEEQVYDAWRMAGIEPPE
jgi:hypothetical protein